MGYEVTMHLTTTSLCMLLETSHTTTATNNNDAIRASNKKQALKDIEHAAQAIAGYIALSRSHKTKELWKNLKGAL